VGGSGRSRGEKRGGRRNNTVHVSGCLAWETGSLAQAQAQARVGGRMECLVLGSKLGRLGLSFGLAVLLHGSATSRESKQTSPDLYEGRERRDVADHGHQKNLVNSYEARRHITRYLITATSRPTAVRNKYVHVHLHSSMPMQHAHISTCTYPSEGSDTRKVLSSSRKSAFPLKPHKAVVNTSCVRRDSVLKHTDVFTQSACPVL
jgi:hypothetical protein